MMPQLPGALTTTETQLDRDRARAAMPQAEIVAVPIGDKPVTVPAAATSVTATTLQPLLISMLRGLAEAAVLAGVSVFTLLAASPETGGRAIFIVAGATFTTKLAAAFGFGTVDQQTAKREG